MTRKIKAPAIVLMFFVTLFSASGASAFCTVAGGCEPIAVGTLTVTYIGEGEKPVAAKFSIYPQGAPASHRNVVLSAETDKPIEVPAGSYDVRIHGVLAFWARDVVIERDKFVSVELGGLAELLITGNNSAGKPVTAMVVVYIVGAERNSDNIVAMGKTNQPFPVIAGTYDVIAALAPDVWFEGVEIARGKTVSISLPEPSSLHIAVADADGNPIGKYVFIEGLGNQRDVRATKETNTDISMSPGKYDISVNVDPNVRFRDIEVVLGKAIKLEIPQRGRLLVKMSDGSKKTFFVYPSGDYDKVVVPGKTGIPISVGPGVYDIKVWDKKQLLPVTIEPGKTVTIETSAN